MTVLMEPSPSLGRALAADRRGAAHAFAVPASGAVASAATLHAAVDLRTASDSSREHAVLEVPLHAVLEVPLYAGSLPAEVFNDRSLPTAA